VTRLLPLWCVAWCAAPAVAAPLATGLPNPRAAAADDKKVYVSVEGGVVAVADGKAEPLAAGFDDPRGLAVSQGKLFVADKNKVRRIDLKTGKADVFVEAGKFPRPPKGLTGLEADIKGGLTVSDADGAVYRVQLAGKGATAQPQVSLVADPAKLPALGGVAGWALDSPFHLLAVDAKTGDLNRVRTSDGLVEKVAAGFPGGGGVAFDNFGQLFVASGADGKVWGVPRPGAKPVPVADGFKSVAHLGLGVEGKTILVTDPKAGTVSAVPARIPGWEVDDTPLAVGTAEAFPGLTWTDWDNGADSGRVVNHRPILVTHAGDGSNRVFVATQHGVIHVLASDKAKATKVFFDIQPKVFYADNENEQGLLGVAFHPRYKETGEVYVFYTLKGQPVRTNVVSRFRVSKSDPDKLDPGTEEEVFRVTHKYWNHDGGTISFGPDGFLYVVLGDGGSGGDPDDNGQNLSLPLGKILRIDVDKRADGKKYAVPADNPFVSNKDAVPEIYAYGVRNPWRLAFDRATGKGWFGEVGQDIWEEVNVLSKGANYGWRRRESFHPFGPDGVGPQPGMTDPVWEYHHRVGKSITGGPVYRGKQFPELDGHYLYADYVTGKIWALKLDDAAGRVVANRPLRDKGKAVMSWGEDEKGEVYLMTYDKDGKGVFKLARD
jgi:glucose/arabinose dehydrogenase